MNKNDISDKHGTMEKKIIERLATEFRRKIELVIKSRRIEHADEILSPYFMDFPKGCCRDASELLGQFLLAKGISTWFVSGIYYPECDDEEMRMNMMQSHAWLSTRSPYSEEYLIIDITADQFSDREEFGYYSKPVYVGEMDDFHRLFTVENALIYKGLENTGSPIQSSLLGLYSLITQTI